MGDLLFEFTEWIRSTFMVDWALAITEWPLSEWIVTNFWAIPIFQVSHILAMSAAFGAVLMMSLRIWGVAGGSYTVPDAARRYIPWMWWGLLALVLSGLLMIVGEPIRELINPIFWIKMGLLVALVLLSIAYNSRVTKRATSHGPEWVASGGQRAGAFGLVILWMVIMAGGRWIAYAPV